MKKLLKGLAFAAMVALSLLASTNDASAKDVKHGRETAWTVLGTLPAVDGSEDPIETDGVTWE